MIGFLRKQLASSSEPAAYVRSAEGRASGTHVPGASSAMKRLARLAQDRYVASRRG